ncbi:MAG TPA: hypothetical protein ENK03_03840, partial [Candidatus Cloacimonetes bacterium]|nr:hypothetical protein [Candidatus Cloacimonadota bacterium]
MTKKHITIQTNYSIKNGNYIYTDFYEKSQEKVALILNSYEKSDKAEKAVGILLNVFKENFYEKSYDVKTRLQNTIREMNWHLTAFFNREKCKFEMSAVICVIKNEVAYFVQTGRLIIYAYNNKLTPIGLDIHKHFEESFHVPMLGIKEGELQIKVLTFDLKHDTDIFILPFLSAKELDTSIKSKDEFLQIFNKLFSENTAPLFHIIASEMHSLYKPRRKFHINSKTAGRFMLIVIIIATAYVIFGRKWGQGLLSSGKEVIGGKMKTLIDYKSLLQNLPGFDVKDWQWISPVEITMPPLLDAENLYIITDDELTCIKKNTFQLRWKAEFEGEIREVESLRDKKLLIIDGRGNHYMLDKAHGNIEWQKAKPATHEKYNKQSPQVVVIDYIRDGRLEQNYYILSHKNLLKLILAGKGEVVAAEEFDDKIDYISDYDYVEKCFYVCMDRKIIKVDLIIL